MTTEIAVVLVAFGGVDDIVDASEGTVSGANTTAFGLTVAAVAFNDGTGMVSPFLDMESLYETTLDTTRVDWSDRSTSVGRPYHCRRVPYRRRQTGGCNLPSLPGKSNNSKILWYDLVFCIKILDDKRVWC